jgi:hypothetical protein
MPFIGNKPSAVPLTSADIADGIIVNADISSTAGITLNKISGNPNFRNIVINGDMQVAQRSTSVASITSSSYNTCDRWNTVLSGLGTWTQSQSTDVPSGYGFAKSLKMDCTTANASPTAGAILAMQQSFEGQNLQYLRKGTANAVSLTASFWVKSTKTGTFIVELVDNDNSRSISKSYTVSVTNTWEFKTVTFDGDTTGALDNDNASSLSFNFWVGAGTTFTSGTLQTTWGTLTSANRAVGVVNIADSTANDWLITGVQLEAGTSATDFEFLPIDVSLGRCQRYYYKLNIDGNSTGSIAIGAYYTSTAFLFTVFFHSSMRGNPAIEQLSSGTDYFAISVNGANDLFNSGSLALNAVARDSADIFVDSNISGTAGHAGRVRFNNASAFIAFTSEL